MLLYLIRHGEPDSTTDRLTERGWAQARLVAARLAKSGIDEIRTSPMGRARETAQPTAELLGLPVSVEEWAYELGADCMTEFPDGQLKTVSAVAPEYFQREEFRRMDSAEAIERIPCIAGSALPGRCRMIASGFDSMLGSLGYRRNPRGTYDGVAPSERKIALFCHAGMMRVMLAHAFNLPFQLLTAALMGNFTGVTILYFHDGKETAPALLCYGDTGHLFAGDEDPTHYFTQGSY